MADAGAAHASAASAAPLPVLLIGTGEYTTGFGKESGKSDKKTGVVLLTMLQLRKEGLVGEISLAGVNGTKVRALLSSRAAVPACTVQLCMRLMPRTGHMVGARCRRAAPRDLFRAPPARPPASPPTPRSSRLCASTSLASSARPTRPRSST